MTLARAFSAPIVLLAGMGLVALAPAVFHREPVVRRTTWCPDPAMRAFVTVPLRSASVLTRLREIRRKAADLGPVPLDLDSPPAPGTFAELDALIRDLIADLDEPETSPEEPKSP